MKKLISFATSVILTIGLLATTVLAETKEIYWTAETIDGDFRVHFELNSNKIKDEKAPDNDEYEGIWNIYTTEAPTSIKFIKADIADGYELEDNELSAFTIDGEIVYQEKAKNWTYTFEEGSYFIPSSNLGFYHILDVRSSGAPAPAPAQKAQAEKTIVTANPTASKVLIDGTNVEFEAYNINGNNYFKIRDLAAALNDTDTRFSVSAGENGAIHLEIGKPYEFLGTELAKGDGTPKQAISNTIIIDTQITSNEFSVFNIGGYNYVKLRDIANLLDISVGYDNDTKIITVDTI